MLHVFQQKNLFLFFFHHNIIWGGNMFSLQELLVAEDHWSKVLGYHWFSTHVDEKRLLRNINTFKVQGESTCPRCIFVRKLCFLAVICAFSIYYESSLSTVVPAQFYLFSGIINSYFSSHDSQVSLCSVTACIWHWDMRWTILLFYFAIWNCTQKYLIKQYSRTNTFQNTISTHFIQSLQSSNVFRFYKILYKIFWCWLTDLKSQILTITTFDLYS